jgi:2-aminoethylphosphonate-pyruvate transaminase
MIPFMSNEVFLSNLASDLNSEKILFTPGPGAITFENLIGLRPYFSRGDQQYEEIEHRVKKAILKLSGQERIAIIPGSATLAIEIAISNFLFGKILLVETGYYSQRIREICEAIPKSSSQNLNLFRVNFDEIENISGRYDWVIACPVETSVGLYQDIGNLKLLSQRVGAKLFLDSTASIGLERNHELADINCFSSCKGLFGITGASFVTYNNNPEIEVTSFYLDLNTHLNKKITGPYHAIGSLDATLSNHQYLKQSVTINKIKAQRKFERNLYYPLEHQPLLCTRLNVKVHALDQRVILYTSRSEIRGSVICHLGELHLGSNADGAILDLIHISQEFNS